MEITNKQFYTSYIIGVAIGLSIGFLVMFAISAYISYTSKIKVDEIYRKQETLQTQNQEMLHQISALKEKTQDISQKTNSIFQTLDNWGLTK